MSYADPARVPENHRDGSDPSIQSEPSGPIAADSLAAESLQSGGEFAANDPSAEPLGVKGANSTLNTTDTSGAVPLPPAASGAAREKAEARGLGSDERGVSGVKYPDADQPDFSGTTTSEGGYYGGPSSDKQGQGYTSQAAGASDFGASTTASTSTPDSSEITSSGGAAQSSSGTTSSSSGSGGPSTGTGVRPHVDAAPNYAGRVSGAITSKNEQQPKGSGLVEGGDVPENMGTFTGNVGGAKDPGRLAEQKFEDINASVAGAGGIGGGKEGTTEQGGQYGVLESERL